MAPLATIGGTEMDLRGERHRSALARARLVGHLRRHHFGALVGVPRPGGPGHQDRPARLHLGHDEVEGVAVLDHRRRLVIGNDNDSGIHGVNESQAPYPLDARNLPDGSQDDGEVLEVRTGR